MKRILFTIFLALVVTLSTAGFASADFAGANLAGANLAAAKAPKVKITGEVVSFDAASLTILSADGETYVVSVPEGYDTSSLQVGAVVRVKGNTAQDGTITATSIKLIEEDGEDGDEDGDGEDGEDGEDEDGDGEDEDGEPADIRENSAFCAEGKQEKPHPLAPKLAERYGVEEDWVMTKFCEGYSMGAIMLAIKTSQIEGMTVTPDELLQQRADGTGWGNIWKDLGLIGSDKDEKTPPGQLKKPDHEKSKDKKKTK